MKIFFQLIVYYNQKNTVKKKDYQFFQNILNDTLFDGIKEGSRKEISVSLLFIQLKRLLLSTYDYLILALTLKELLIPTNEAIEKVPTTESTNFARKFGKAVLDVKKEMGFSFFI